jgi:uncharacterized membrane protein
LIVAEFRKWPEAPPWTATMYWGSYFFWSAIGHSSYPAESRFLWLTLGFVLFFAWIVWWAVLQKRALRSTDLVVLAANAAAYFGASYYALNPNYHAYMGLFAAALGALNLVLAKLVWNPEAVSERDSWPALLAVAVTLTFLTLAVPIQFSGFRITIAWALEGAALAWLSSRFKSSRILAGALLVLLLVVFRLFAYDAMIYSLGNQYKLIANTRFFTFVVSAASLMAAAKFFADRVPARISYIAGHVVLLASFGMEIIGWAERSVATADQFSTITVAISIEMGLYAVILVTAGVVTRTAVNRILGLGLIGIVVLKLYLSDVWELGRVFRILAFMGLGAMLLAVSYLYSRFRDKIGKLWKDEPAE